MRASLPHSLPLDTSSLKPGLRLAVGVSGGADSVALLRALEARAGELGLALHAAHLHHGLRAEEADADLDFVRSLAATLGIPFHESRVNVAAEAKKAGESVEEAARRLRYGWFRTLMAEGEVDAVATAHTRDDQAETVCQKFLRGAWTEGLSGIHPAVEFPEGRVLRPLLAATRAQVEAYLGSIGQAWREDLSNRDVAFTRNRIRHELLPVLEEWNPRIKEHLAQMAVLARDEEAWWRHEVARLAPQILMEGKPVRGGGRASGDGVALDVIRLAALERALQRRLLRFAVERLGVSLDFRAIEALRALALEGRAGQKRELAHGLRAERTPRELRLSIESVWECGGASASKQAIEECSTQIPGEIVSAEFGLRLRIGLEPKVAAKLVAKPMDETAGRTVPSTATLRIWKPGDRVRLRYSSGPRKVKEVLERLRVTGSDRARWPVLEVGGRIAWMKGVEAEPEEGILVRSEALE
jgi:tRNA(Ile)-lysidine synthase